jgi:hypothetical protein
LLRQGDDVGSFQPPQEFTQTQGPNETYNQPSQAPTEATTQELDQSSQVLIQDPS